MIVVDVIGGAVIDQCNLLVAPVNIFPQGCTCPVEQGDELAGLVVVINFLCTIRECFEYPLAQRIVNIGRCLGAVDNYAV